MKNILNEILIERNFFRCITKRQIFANVLIKIVEDILRIAVFQIF